MIHRFVFVLLDGPLMKLVSLNVGMPRDIVVEGGVVRTSIFKYPVDRRLRVRTLNIEGDEQSDLTVHGGIHKAVYAYPSEHYVPWSEELPDVLFPWGVFGENLTTIGLDETVRAGDRFRIGTAELVVTQPRLPCFKLGIRFGRADMLKRMLQTGRSGFYLAVATEGEIGPGDSIERLAPSDEDLTIADLVLLYTGKQRDKGKLQIAADSKYLPEGWKAHFRDRLN